MSTNSFRHLSRRSFLSLSAFAPLAGLGLRPGPGDARLHHFAYDHVIGTSLDLDVWTSSGTAAQRAARATLDEIERLASILDTRDPASEISRFDDTGGAPSADLSEILAAYSYWTHRTGGTLSIRPYGPGTPRNVDALGKAYILDRAAMAAGEAPDIDGVLLNIGGDIVVMGGAREIAITDPGAWQDNAAPMTHVRIENAAIATSGAYARGAHLVDGRTGQTARLASSATVIARNAVTANALATTLCVTDADTGLQLVNGTPGAEALRVSVDGAVQRTSGFARLEQPRVVPARAAAGWPAGYEVNISLTLTNGAPGFGGRRGFGGRGGRGGRGGERQYVAVWVEDMTGRLVRVLAFWASKPRYFNEVSSFFNLLGRNQNRLSALARATRPPGNYRLVWDGLDDKQTPVPPGAYRVVVETNQEHGSYGKQSGTIECGATPVEIATSGTPNFEPVTIQYGPRPRPV